MSEYGKQTRVLATMHFVWRDTLHRQGGAN